MRTINKILPLFILFFINGCVSQFYPETNEDKDLLVVEGLITDQQEANVIKLSMSMPLGTAQEAKPLSGCSVMVSDDLGNSYMFYESKPGTYVSDPNSFRGIIGRTYIIYINTGFNGNYHSYESRPAKLTPVPPIDSLYYEKVVLVNSDPWSQLQEGCQIYLDTHDPENNCKYYRWEFTETWEFHLPYNVPNNVCWISDNSNVINIKNTSAFADARIDDYPIDLVTNKSDRLGIKYSILVDQYSLDEDEYQYWDKLQNLTENVGGLYDIIPASIPSNVTCIDDPTQKVLGYFSVSAKSSKRLFVRDRFSGWLTPYTSEACVADTVYNGAFIPNLDVSVWVIIDHQLPPPAYKVTTYTRGCADCTVRGTKIKPEFWDDVQK